MNLQSRLTKALTAVLVAAVTLPVSASIFSKKDKRRVDTGDVRKLTPAQNALIDKSVVREAAVIKALRARAPIVETYIQNMRPDPVMGQVPESDVHFLGRINFGKIIGDNGYIQDKQDTKGFLKHSLSYLTGLSGSLHLTYNRAGFVQMLLVDSNSYNRQTYTFSFLRNDFLGTIPTVVFDVQPTKKDAVGRFAGRIWIDRNSGNIVRFNGSFSGGQKDYKEYYHFDSWRTNVQEGLWLPTSVYIEESDPKSPQGTLKFKAVNHIWGYSLKVPQSDADETDLQVVGAQDESQQASDVSPLQAQREWVEQAEDNVIDRLYTAGLIDAPSDFDKILEALANNILAYNNIPLDRPIKVRTLLTEPLESLSVGDTILLSKGLIDTTAVPTADGAQQMGNLNALLAFQVAHIVLGHHIDTKYAFSDRLMFPTESAFEKLPMHHTDADNEAAAKKAIELLSAKELEGGEQYFSLYLQQLQAREKGLKALTDPQIGDGLLRPDGTFWMQALISKGPKLNNSDLKQQAAMPLSQFLRFDPWTDQVIKMNTAYEPLLSARDKLPFEITPVYLRLAYWTPPAAPPAAPAPASAAPATNSPSASNASPAPTTTDNASAAPATAPATQPQP
ncbi:MAG TPA: hypothetical protein VMD97_04545 [Candidatus Aquilonibacter sp.]|nr:hypothetical protein [Candidatus Aquilonibacter sp.]